MSKKKFLRVSEEWAKNAKENLINLIEGILDENELTMEEFCGFIDTDQDEINNFLYDDGELSLLTIAKLLIGSNLAVEVKHVKDTEIGSYYLDDDDCDGDEEASKKTQPRDEKGRFKSYNDIKKKVEPELEDWDCGDDAEDDTLDGLTYLEDAIRETLDRNPERIFKLLKAIFEV